MGDTTQDRDDTMHVMRIDDPLWLGTEAKRMAAEMVEAEGRMGEKFDAVAYRLFTKYRVEPSIIKQCWNRPPREMKVSRWMNLFQGYLRYQKKRALNAERHAKADYEEKRREIVAHGHPALLRLADLVAGRADRPAD